MTPKPQAASPGARAQRIRTSAQMLPRADCLVSDHEPGLPSIGAARRSLASRFRGAGLDTPELDARLIVGHALSVDHAALAAQSDRRLTREDVERIAGFAARRLAREPVARLLGRKEFWGLSLALNAHTLVPRPETETVVTAVLEALPAIGCARPVRIADLGTGSGAVLLALLSELKEEAVGMGTDISPGALACAAANAAAYCLSPCFLACDYGAALRGPIDILVCNPPYIAGRDMALLEPEVRLYDPSVALNGGLEGLDGYRAVAAEAARLLSAQGLVVTEIGLGQAAAVSALFAGAGLAPLPPQHDLSGIPRAIVARRLL
jgi:release factor glutamine methyltransferase